MKKSSSSNKPKIQFGKRKKGSHSKSRGPKQKAVSKYRRQGR